MHTETVRASLLSALSLEESHHTFDLGTGPLVRFHLVKETSDRWVFMFTLHHIVSDGWSMEVMVREVQELYGAYHRGEVSRLQPLRIQYKDYAAWQNEQLSGEALSVHRAYWHGQLSGELPVLDLPSDYPRPAVKTYSGQMLNTVLSASVYEEAEAS